MKKKLMAVLLVAMMVLAAGCGNKGKVTIGEYKGLALTSVTQAEVDAELDAIEQGSLNSSGANFKMDLFSIKFGLTFYL